MRHTYIEADLHADPFANRSLGKPAAVNNFRGQVNLPRNSNSKETIFNGPTFTAAHHVPSSPPPVHIAPSLFYYGPGNPLPPILFKRDHVAPQYPATAVLSSRARRSVFRFQGPPHTSPSLRTRRGRVANEALTSTSNRPPKTEFENPYTRMPSPNFPFSKTMAETLHMTPSQDPDILKERGEGNCRGKLSGKGSQLLSNTADVQAKRIDDNGARNRLGTSNLSNQARFESSPSALIKPGLENGQLNAGRNQNLDSFYQRPIPNFSRPLLAAPRVTKENMTAAAPEASAVSRSCRYCGKSDHTIEERRACTYCAEEDKRRFISQSPAL